jgi:hypothetical protein
MQLEPEDTIIGAPDHTEEVETISQGAVEFLEDDLV